MTVYAGPTPQTVIVDVTGTTVDAREALIAAYGREEADRLAFYATEPLTDGGTRYRARVTRKGTVPPVGGSNHWGDCSPACTIDHP